MAYKRSSKKGISQGSRRTNTVNTNGNITNTSSTENRNYRVTDSWSSKNGYSRTITSRNGAGFITRRKLAKSRYTARSAFHKNSKLEKTIAFGILLFLGMAYLFS